MLAVLSPTDWGVGQARSQVLRFGGVKYIFHFWGQDFCIHDMFKTNYKQAYPLNP